MGQSDPYKHRQTGTLIIYMMSILSLVLILSIGMIEPWYYTLSFIVVLVLVAIIFGSLTVEVRDEKLRFWFGPGIIRKSYDLQEITSATVVKNHWYYGWGIRLTPSGWLYNVSGWMAVELTLVSGKSLRIGTDEPHVLVAYVQSEIQKLKRQAPV
ncbi:MAG: hypothetical protein HOH43_05320 [Candidatus Latescibacteria bacterium]|jgi:hypothetical protein|nr:hypothetical protein [Candidatus Latescibacterota bacterium]